MNKRVAAQPPVIPGLTYVDVLGMGGFADVFRYEQLGRHVAVKVLTTDLSYNTQQAFEAEAKLMARLSTHPAIVSVYQAGATADNRSYLMMEVCQPRHLGARLRQKTFSVAKALEVTIQIAGAVESAHRLGVLHRDIKPANILFTEFGRPALTDFGISVSRQEGELGRGVGVSPMWAPPEQLRSGAPMTPASDVYSLAATCWAMLVGRSPFDSTTGANDSLAVTQRVLRERVPPTRREGVPEALERVLSMAMAKEASHRYTSALEFGRALQAVQTSLHMPTTPIEVGEDTAFDDLDEDEGDSSTKISSFKVIDPDFSAAPRRRAADAEPAAAPFASGVEARDPGHPLITTPRAVAAAASTRDFTGLAIPTVEVDRTELRAGDVETATPAAATEPSGVIAPHRSRRPVIVLGALAVLLLLAGWLAISAALSGDGAGTTDDAPPESDTEPADALGGQVDRVTKLRVERKGKTISATWDNADAQPGDQYLYRIVDPAHQRPYQGPIQTPSVTVPVPAGRACLQVQLVRESGRPSEAVTKCTK